MSQSSSTTQHNQISNLQTPTQNGRNNRRNTPDPTDPIAILAPKGVTKENCTNPGVLAAIIEQFGDFRTGPTNRLTNVTAIMATELQALAKLLREMEKSDTTLQQNRDLLTKQDLKDAIQELKNSLESTNGAKTYANVVRNHTTTNTNTITNTTANRNLKTPQNHEIKEKQILISTKNVEKTADIFIIPPSELTRRCNKILTMYFTQAINGNLEMIEPIRAISRSNTGNLTLTFKRTTEAEKARLFADEWITALNPRATVPQRQYAVVAHNAPASIWNGDDLTMDQAIRTIEAENSDATNIDYSISKLNWLNSSEAREKTNRGPLLISFKSRIHANAAIDQCIAFNGEMCNINIFVPRAPQCFRCQDWGHRATECTGEARCGICADNHETTNHRCTHDDPCPTDQKCNTEKPKCANCNGDHASWVRSCPAAKAAFAEQLQRDEYRTGRYESSTPFTLADAFFKVSKPKRTHTTQTGNTSNNTADNPGLNLIPATSPPDDNDI